MPSDASIITGAYMFIEMIQKPLAALLILVLLFTMSQKRYMRRGTRKREASLFVAAAVLVLYAVTFFILRFNLPQLVFPAVIAAEIVFFVLFRNRLPYRRHCTVCGKKLPIGRILYYDSNQCPECDPDEQKDDPQQR